MDSFIFYRSFYEAIKGLDKDDQLAVYQAISEYILNDQYPLLTGVSNSIFILIKPQLDANKARRENGSKGGRPKTKPKPRPNLDLTKGKPNVNVNANVNENENDSNRGFKKPTLEEIAEYCRERKNGIDPKRFFNHYESNGWKVGRVSMKDWRASIRTWENNTVEKKNEQVIPYA